MLSILVMGIEITKMATSNMKKEEVSFAKRGLEELFFVELREKQKKSLSNKE